MNFGLSYFIEALKYGIRAAPLTLSISLVSFLISLFFGSLIASCRVYNVKFFAKFFKIHVDLIKAIPGILIIYIVYFFIADGINALSDTFGWSIRSNDISMNAIAIVALTLMGSVFVSETIRGALLSISKGQYEAGYSVGLTFAQVFRRVILPQMIPVALPVLCNNIIIFIKLSSILYFISVLDILNATMIAATASYRFLESYIAAALLYWAIGFIVEKASKIVEIIMSRYKTTSYS